MPESGDETHAPALDAARRRRVELHDALVGAEEAISRPTPGREPDWAADAGKAFTHLRDAFDEHVRGTEEPGGLYDEVLERAPQLAGKVGRLRDEHPRLQADLSREIARLSEPVGEAFDADAVRDDLQRVLGLVVRHRQHGADLVWEAYNLDIGGAG
ncbi:MAG TPA: hypothetical protein VGH10_12330 [Actinomycetota bacterium]